MDNNDLFKHEKSVFQKQINDAMKTRENTDIIKDIIKLILLKNANKNESALKLVELYNYFGIDAFVDVIDIMNGKTVTFPEIDEFKDIIKTAVSYYYKFLKGKSWNEIKEILDDPDCSSIKYGINCSKLNKFITELSEYQAFVEKHGDSENGKDS